MELRHLRYFVAVATELSFTQAAEKLCVVQPSLSQQIKDLEEEVGVLLLDRSKRKIALTPEGEGFLNYARQAIAHAENAIATARQIAYSTKNKLKIGVLPSAEIKILPKILNTINQKYPNQPDIQLLSLTCIKQIQMLKNAELDLAFTRFQLDDEEYVSQLIFEEHLCLVSDKNIQGYHLAQSLKMLAKEQFIGFSRHSSPALYEVTSNFFKQEQLTLQKTLASSNLMQHINLINMGNTWSIIPKYVTAFLKPEIQVLDLLEQLPKVPLYANYRKKNSNMLLQDILGLLNSLQFKDAPRPLEAA